MRERYIPAFIMLLAGAITSVINIVNKVDKIAGLKRLLLVIVIFYFIGLIVRAIVNKGLSVQSIQEETEENNEEEEAQPEDKKE